MSFSFAMPYVIDHTKVGAGTHTDFPLLIKIRSANLKDTAHSGHVTSTSGFDIEFFSDSGLTTKLDHYLSYFGGAVGDVIAWVRMPTGTLPNNSSDTTIYFAYGDAGITTDQSTASTFDSHYVSVWPIGSTVDYTGHNALTNSNATLAQTGKIYQSSLFSSASAHKMYAADSASFDSITGAYTLSCWVNTVSHSGTLGIIYFKATGAWSSAAVKTIDYGLSGSMFYSTNAKDVNSYMHGQKTLNPSDGTWYYLCASWDGVTSSNVATKVFTNGVKSSETGAIAGTMTATQTNDYIATIAGGSTNYGLNGYLEQLRLSNSERSEGWILTEYNNQNDPNSFGALGDEVAVGGGGGPAGVKKVEGVSLAAIKKTSGIDLASMKKIAGVA